MFIIPNYRFVILSFSVNFRLKVFLVVLPPILRLAYPSKRLVTLPFSKIRTVGTVSTEYFSTNDALSSVITQRQSQLFSAILWKIGRNRCEYGHHEA